MVIIQGVLISRKLFTKSFVCNLTKCKGACCWEGDYGAPLTDEEIDYIEHDLERILTFLPDAHKQRIKDKGFYTYYKGMRDTGTELMPDKACVFMTKDKNGIAQCGIEQANKKGKSSLRKPLSCHLYPIRMSKNAQSGLQRMEYDEWDICSAACQLGEKLKVPVYQFLKEAIIRKFGDDFYAELDAFGKHLESQDKSS